MMRKIAVLVAVGLLLGGLLAAPAAAQEEPNYARVVLPEIIERPVVPPAAPPAAPPAVPPEVTPEPAIAATGLDLTLDLLLAALLLLGGVGALLLARRRRGAAA